MPCACCCRLTTQAQRPGARDAWIANHSAKPGSLQRMVGHRECRDSKTLSHKQPLVPNFVAVLVRAPAETPANPSRSTSRTDTHQQTIQGAKSEAPLTLPNVQSSGT